MKSVQTDWCPNGHSLLEVQNLSVEFMTDHGQVQVIEDVSFSLNEGETLAIVGESGSGKTVTGLALMGLLPKRQASVTSGSVHFHGEEITGLSTRALEDVRGRRLAMIFQEPLTSLNPVFRVGDQLSETIRRHKGVSRREALREAISLLDRVGIPNAPRRLRSYPHELSGGQRQRVMIAMAISCEPQVLIADEPTTALDVTIQAQVLELLHSMQGDLGLGLLFITHDLGVVANIADRVIVMYAGQVVEHGTTYDCFENPAHPYTEGLLQAMPQVSRRAARLAVIPGTVPLPWEFRDDCRFLDRCSYAESGCARPVALETYDNQRDVRCLRATSLVLKGVE